MSSRTPCRATTTARSRALLVVLVGLPIAGAQAQSTTFARDVAPIFRQKCLECHRPGTVAPMSLLTYEDARRNASRIRSKVASRTMPPWHIDTKIGIQAFKNDRSLSDAQIATIVRWVEGGAAFGDSADLPAPTTLPDFDRWQLAATFGHPELVIRTSPFAVPARGTDKWVSGVSETGLTEARWVRAIEVKPLRAQDRRVVHHVMATLQQKAADTEMPPGREGDFHAMDAVFMEWAVGKVGQIYPPDAGKLMLPSSRLGWNVHYHPNGIEVTASQVEIGVYFHPKGFVPKHAVTLTLFQVSRGPVLDIPPGETVMTQNFYTLQAPARLENFQPHMHLRGKAMSLEAILPDGSKRILSLVNNFQWNWLTNYVYADSVAPLLPKGTVLAFTAWHDNTAANPSNPDPAQWVGWGSRLVDEMADCLIDVVYLTQAEYESLVAERKARGGGRGGAD